MCRPPAISSSHTTHGTVGWPGHQHARELYEAALDFYAADEWGLIENGDVEDFWLAGGSTYGVARRSTTS